MNFTKLLVKALFSKKYSSRDNNNNLHKHNKTLKSGIIVHQIISKINKSKRVNKYIQVDMYIKVLLSWKAHHHLQLLKIEFV